jgi:hypothetical protein
MAHDQKHPEHQRPRHDLRSAPPFVAGGPWHSASSQAETGTPAGTGASGTGTGAGAAAKLPNPFSWAIEELQGDLDLPASDAGGGKGQVDTNGAAASMSTSTSPIARRDVETATRHPGDRERERERELGDSSHFMHRRPVARTTPPQPPPPPGVPPVERPESHQTLALALPSPNVPDTRPEPEVAEPGTSFHEPAMAWESRPLPKREPESETEPRVWLGAGSEPAPVPRPVASTVAAPLSAPTSTSSGGFGRLFLTATLALVFGVIGGMIGTTLRSPNRPLDNIARSNPASASGTDSMGSAVAANAKAIEELRARLGQLDEQLATVGPRIDHAEMVQARKIELPEEFFQLRAEVNRLTTATNELADLPDEFQRYDKSLGRIVESIKGLRDELAVVRVKAETAAVAAAPAPAPASPTERTGDDPAANTSEDARYLVQGMKLFKQNRFKEALGVFNRLELTSPDDARVWYFAALSHGFATGQWSGGTERLVEKALERERAGTPNTELINAAFSDLTDRQGRDWIAEYRRRGAPRTESPAAGPAHGHAPASAPSPSPSPAPAPTPAQAPAPTQR